MTKILRNWGACQAKATTPADGSLKRYTADGGSGSDHSRVLMKHLIIPHSAEKALLPMCLLVLPTAAFPNFEKEGANDRLSDDPNVDGISNLMEFVLGAPPMVSARDILPEFGKPAGNWLFDYDRSKLPLSPATTEALEHGSDLIGWTPVIGPATSADGVTITPSNPSARVTVTIPNVGPQTFIRL